MMFADTETFHADLLGQDGLVDDAADRLGLRNRPPVGINRDIAEGIQTELHD
jgi:hypothetical protein